MKILYVTSEANPFIASGGLGDVMGAVPVAISELKEAEVEVIMPLYDAIKHKYGDKLEKCLDISFNLSWRKTGASIYRTYHSGVPYYFVENSYYFDRGKLYGEWDDGERFAFFSTAVVEYMLKSGNIPDVLHSNDWQTALTVIYLKTKYAFLKEFLRVKTIYTIHNIEYQGKYDKAILGDVFALGGEYESIVENDGCINLMKGAIVTSDLVGTVSPNYANELQYDFFAFGLSDIVKASQNKMRGIINGIDYNFFSPDKGGDIDYPFNKRCYKAGKAKNKAALQKELGLNVRPDVPLVAMITRLASQKGIDLLLRVLEELLSEDLQFVILGTGEKEYEDVLMDIASRHGNMKALIKFDRVTSKKMYASADIFLMPSKSEPCGLSQMISCAYGTVPVVRAVGGLYDSITPYGEENSNGFTFNNYNAHEMLFALKGALNLYRNKTEWNALSKRAINTDFSWSKSATEYMALYKTLIQTDRM